MSKREMPWPLPGSSGAGRFCSGKVSGALAALAMLASLLAVPAQSGAQVPNPRLPQDGYYLVFGEYYQAEYARAAKQFQGLSNTAYRDANGRFLDSICYWTMLGECLYHTGNYRDAIQNYEAALNLYLVFRGWPARTQLPTVQADPAGFARARISWGTSTRNPTLGRFPDSVNMLLGNLNNDQALSAGGVVDRARLRPVDMVEVMRCVALAAHRRHMIKGPTCKHDPFTRQLVNQLAADGGGGATIPGAFNGVVLGIAQAAAGDWGQAVGTLERSLTIAGGLDHPLTPVALLQIGHAAFAAKNWDAAQRAYLEASFSAAVFNQYDLIEESLHWANTVQMVARPNQLFEPLAPAAEWAARERARMLQASLIVQLATAHAEIGGGEEALRILGQARRPMSGNDLSNSLVGAEAMYASALAKSQTGDGRGAARDLDTFLRLFVNGSKWLYQLGLADELITGNRVALREADSLYAELLREPTADDWKLDPMETVAYLVSPHTEPMARWFEISMSRKLEQQAIEISELIRRHRFFSALPLGGRMLAFRWVLQAPDEALSQSESQRKRDLLARFPKMKELSDQSAQVVDQLRKLPVAPERGSAQHTQQRNLLDQLGTIAASQEIMLQALALRREPCEFAFPPQMTLEEIQARLGDKQLIIATMTTGSMTHLMFISRGAYSHESTVATKDVQRALTSLLRDLGLSEKSATVDAGTLTDGNWRQSALELTGLLFPRTSPDVLERYEEVIIVPDGLFWYVPFELLQVAGAGQAQAQELGSLVKLRYAPTLSTAIPDGRARRRFARTALVASRIHPKDEQTVIDQGVADLQRDLPDVELLDKTFNGPSSLLAAAFDQLVVWQELKESERAGLSLAPLQLDLGKPGSGLDSWMLLPWPGPDMLVLPGFASQAERAARDDADGSELFVTACALMASGCRSILLSRWRVGGQTGVDLTREFAREAQTHPPLDAWQRSVQMLKDSEIDLDTEPRIRDAKLDQPLKADHPLFWAGYMLIDSGSSTPNVDDPDAAGVDGAK